MISLIICSRSDSIPAQLNINIAQTIGVEYELIVIDNSQNNYSIFEAYNIGASKSRYPYLCFMHDDILYYTPNWGNTVLNHFNDVKIGAIGIAGSPYFPLMPGSWWGGGMVNEYIIPAQAKDLQPSIKYTGASHPIKKEVVVLDGVWMCMRKSLFENIRFDGEVFKGYHFYDIDICLQIHKNGYQLFVIYDILIKHFSDGNVNKNWVDNAILTQNKWKKNLPASVLKLESGNTCSAELKTLDEFLDLLLCNHTPKSEAFQIVIYQLLTLTKRHFCYKTLLYLAKYLKKIFTHNISRHTS